MAKLRECLDLEGYLKGMNKDREMTITIKYLVNLSEKAGKRKEDVDFPKESTMNDVIGYLKKTRNIILPSPGILALLNGRGWDQFEDKWNTTIADGDILLLLPMISGG